MPKSAEINHDRFLFRFFQINLLIFPKKSSTRRLFAAEKHVS